MSDKPKFLSFQGSMYVRADQFVRPLTGQTFSGGTNREAITRAVFADGSWFEAGDRGYKAWPLGTELVKVGLLGQEPEPIKMKLDLDVNEALEKIESVIARTQLADELSAKIAQSFIFNAQNLTVSQAKISNSIQSDDFVPRGQDGKGQGWRLDAESGDFEFNAPHRN